MPRDTTSLPLSLLAAAGFLSVAGARIIDPLVSMISHDFRVSVPEISVAIAAFTLSYGLSQLVLGPVGDRYGKLRVMLGALVGYTVFTTACATATSLPALTVLRACAGASSAGLIPVCLAYIGDAVPYEMRQITLGRFATGVVMAQILAGPLGGAIGEFIGWRGAFVLLGAMGLAVAAILALRMRHLPDRSSPNRRTLATYRALLQRTDARLLLAATMMEGALFGGILPFIAPYLRARFLLPYGVIGLVLACFGIGTLLYTRVARFIVPRVDEAGLVLAGGIVMGASILAVMACNAWGFFVPGLIAIGFGYFVMHTVLQTRATELLPDARSTAVSIFVFLLFFGQAIGAMAIGAAISAWGYRVAFSVAAWGLVLLGCSLCSLLRRHPATVRTA
jgi:predicted MFS family arabinose efflux permease